MKVAEDLQIDLCRKQLQVVPTLFRSHGVLNDSEWQETAASSSVSGKISLTSIIRDSEIVPYLTYSWRMSGWRFRGCDEHARFLQKIQDLSRILSHFVWPSFRFDQAHSQAKEKVLAMPVAHVQKPLCEDVESGSEQWFDE